MEKMFCYSDFKIKFNSRLYDLEAIQISIKAFAEFFNAEILDSGELISVNLKFNEGCGKEVVREFCNYILGVMQNNR